MKKYLILIILAFVFSCNQNLEIENNVNTWVVEQTETEKFHANMKVTKTGWVSFWEIEELRWIFEEILIHFGLMTLLAWIFYKIFKKKNIWIFVLQKWSWMSDDYTFYFTKFYIIEVKICLRKKEKIVFNFIFWLWKNLKKFMKKLLFKILI